MIDLVYKYVDIIFVPCAFIALWFSKETKHASLDKVEERKATVGIETTSP
jgi:hypothetical protein